MGRLLSLRGGGWEYESAFFQESSDARERSHSSSTRADPWPAQLQPVILLIAPKKRIIGTVGRAISTWCPALHIQ